MFWIAGTAPCAAGWLRLSLASASGHLHWRVVRDAGSLLGLSPAPALLGVTVPFDLDAVLQGRRGWRDRVLEVDAAASFRAWALGRSVEAGLSGRRALVEGWLGSGTWDLVRRGLPASDVGDDALADAFAALWSARRIADGTSQLQP